MSRYKFRVGDVVVLNRGAELTSQYHSGDSSFKAMIKTLLDLEGVVDTTSGDLVRVTFPERETREIGGPRFVLNENLIKLKAEKERPKPMHNPGEILVSENQDYDFRGIFILKKFDDFDIHGVHEYHVMLSEINGVKHMLKNNNICGSRSNIRKATEEEIEELKSAISNRSPREFKPEDYSKYF